jgi:flagellar hook-associated protein 2
MATITSSGAGSGLNVNALVAQLVAAERAPYDAKLARTEAKLNSEFTSLAQLKGAMSGFQVALAALKKPADFEVRKTVVGADAPFTATATSSAATGSYEVEVQQLAKASQLGSGAFVSGPSTVVGTGALTISMGSTSFDVTMIEGANTLAQLRDAINVATGNPGVRATLIRDIAGSHLVVTGSATGEANALRISASGGDGALAQFAHDPPTTANMQVLSAAQDAIVLVSGYEIRDADNVIDDAIEGVTLSLTKAITGTPSSLTVQIDNAGIQSRVNSFVTSYNTLATQISKLRSYNPETKAAGPMLGDAMLRNLEAQLRRTISSPVVGATQPYTSLASMGITSSLNGTLTLDQQRFDAALLAEPAAAATLFASTNGLAITMDALLTERLSTSSEIATRDAGVASKRKDLIKQQAALNTRMEVVLARYSKQFNSLDSLLTSLQSTSRYLTQQLNTASPRL